MNWLTSRCAPLVALSALALASCDKGTDLNVDLPETTAISTEYQDFPLTVATVRLSPVQTLKTDHFLVGSLVDNVAGTTEARAYFNVVTTGRVDSLPSKLPLPVLDSALVITGFDKVYGSSTTPVRFDVLRLAASLDERQVYNSETPTATGAPIARNLSSRLDRTRLQVLVAAVPASPTTVAIPAVTTTVPDPTLRLLLHRRAVPATPTRPAISAVPSPFIDSLFARLSSTSTNFGQTQLNSILKGLAIVPSVGHTTNIVSFSRILDARIILYFHATGAPNRTYSVLFGPAFSGVGANPVRDPRYYTRIINTLPANLSVLASRAGAVSASALSGTSYVQEGTGLATRVTFQGLETLKATPNLTVNRAEIRVPVKPFSNALFDNPPQLYAVEVDANNVALQRTINFIAADRVVQADGANQLGSGFPATGALNNATSTQAHYSLPITNYLDAYLKDKLEGNPASLVLTPSIQASNTLSLNRAVLDANNITLRVYYSKK
ncbi:DUF4270 family protein [Hymenobacter antarcticus]|uniref:DUF4270 family protein n=1 Tax=Hymenobacter antarcticus TaxID=486270 RepID=A0ABP7P2U8_9BACT